MLILQQMKKNHKLLQHLKFICEKYVILVEHCKNLTLLSNLKGSNYYKNVNFRVKSVIGIWYIRKPFRQTDSQS